MRALLTFARSVATARERFRPGDHSSWLRFYQAKQDAYADLLAAQPAIKAVPEFWRLVQNRLAHEWVPLVAKEIQCLTRDCKVQCDAENRRRQYREAKQRQAQRQQMRLCPVCKIERLAAGKKICKPCQRAAAARRSKRFRAKLKDAARNGIADQFMREANSTKSTPRLFMPLPGNVEGEAVTLAKGVA